jgi:hypothetical protein
MRKTRVLVSALVLALLAAVVAVPGIQIASGPTERLTNGDFEAGFYPSPAGLVGNGWHWFHNGGQADHGFYDDTWTPVVYDGLHSQLIEISTFGRAASDPDRYAGIYQSVAVVPGETYELALCGMLRALEDDPDRSGYNYRVQYGVDYVGGTDWMVVDNWVELPWDSVHPRLSPGSMESFSTSITATSTQLTLFVRVWKKWGTVSRELDVNLDAISLRGAMPSGSGAPEVSLAVPAHPVVGWEYPIPVASSSSIGITLLELYENGALLSSVGFEAGLLSLSHEFTWTPASVGTYTLKVVAHDASGTTVSSQASLPVGAERQLLVNGGFEDGFRPIPNGRVGNGWGWFHNGGEATYGFYDDNWEAVVYDGNHSQLIEINTFCRGGSDPDRYAGIYQAVDGLSQGATYRLTLHGMLRAHADDEDRVGFNYRVQWGYDPLGGSDWTVVDNWIEVPWDTVYDRLSPGVMGEYKTTLVAPSSRITLFVRVWKKWGTVRRELDVNLDAISLTGS